MNSTSGITYRTEILDGKNLITKSFTNIVAFPFEVDIIPSLVLRGKIEVS